MDGTTTGLIMAAVISLAGLAVVITTTSKPKALAPKLSLPVVIIYFTVAVSIAMSLASPRLTSTSVTDVVENTLGNSIAKAATLTAVAVFALSCLVSLKSRTRVPAIAGALLTYGAVGFLSALVNGQPLELGGFYLYLLIAGVALSASWTTAEAINVVRRCLRTYIWLSLFLMFVAPAMAFWDVQGREIFGIKQLAGVTTHPNGLGTVAAVAVFVELFKGGGIRRARRWHLAAALVVVVLTQSRGAWLAVGIGLIFWVLGRAKNTSVAVAVPLIISVVAASMFFQDQIMTWLEGKTTERDLSTLNGRTLIWEQAITPVWDSPMLGKGPLVFDPRFRWDALGLSTDAGHSNAHNQIIQTLVERGFLGLFVLAVFAVLLLRAAWHQPLNYRGPMLAIAVLFVFRFAVETPLYVSTASLNSAVLVLLVALFTAKPDKSSEKLHDRAEDYMLRPDIFPPGIRGRSIRRGSRYAIGLDSRSRS